MTTGSVLDRVSRAIFEEVWPGIGWDTVSEDIRELYRGVGLAALRAYRG